MKTLSDFLRDGDPIARDPRLSDDESAELRRRIVHEASRRPQRQLGWQEPLALLGALALLMIAAAVTDRRSPRASTSTAAATTQSFPSEERRQLQFATPGGTRIIWTFDPEFSLKGPVR